MTLGSRETDETGGMIRDLLHAGRKRILLNLEKVSYIDSASVGMLVAHFKRAAERGAVVKLLRPSEKTLAVLVTARLDLVFEIFQDETEAISSY
jgi:anti-sigma B factor antagonist